MQYIDNQLRDFLNNLCSSDLQSFINVLDAHLENSFKEHIDYIGFNTSSGNVYLMLDNKITIASAFGQSVEYITSD
jgi:hypothetical protein